MRIGFTCSSWDLLHSGHILMLREAKSQCDYLIVGLQTDPTIDRPETKNLPVQSLVERYTQLGAVEYVDEIIPYQTEKELEEILLSYPINVRIIGSEYKNKNFTGKNICRERGIEIYYNTRDHTYSTTSLRERIENAQRIKKYEQETKIVRNIEDKAQTP
jgi:glycerol-3-phosphate cytidylyltransferase